MKTVTLDFAPGTSVEECAIALVTEARRAHPQKLTAEFKFNGHLLKATPDTVPSQIVDQYHVFCVESSERFKATPEGQRIERERLARKQRIADASDPGMTIYSYILDNSDGRWEKLNKGDCLCFELWNGVNPIDAIVGAIPDSWPKEANVFTKDSPDLRFT
jgi:hypothetical protein